MPAPAAVLLVPTTGEEPSEGAVPPREMRSDGPEAASGPDSAAEPNGADSPTPTPDSTPNPVPTVLEWTAHPAVERPGIAAAALAVIVMLSLAVGMTAGSMAWSLLAAFLLLAAVRRFYLSSKYRVDERGVSARHILGARTLRWSRVRRVAADDNGAFVGPTPKRTWLDPVRGIHLLFPASVNRDERDRIVAEIRRRAGLLADDPVAAPSASSSEGDD